MSSPFKLVASDIDGTLIRTDGTLSERTIEVLDALPVPFVVVTGRPVRWLRQLFDQMAAPVPAICANGAVIYDPDRDEVLRADPLSGDLLLDVSKRLREAVPDIALAVEVEDGRAFWYEEA
jgi:HAD superfamily hydrolase (TIGR01484 family)